MFVLKHFAGAEENFQFQQQAMNTFAFKFEKDNKLVDVDPPLLYKKPSDYDIKKMVKIYLENKNMI